MPNFIKVKGVLSGNGVSNNPQWINAERITKIFESETGKICIKATVEPNLTFVVENHSFAKDIDFVLDSLYPEPERPANMGAIGRTDF